MESIGSHTKRAGIKANMKAKNDFLMLLILNGDSGLALRIPRFFI